MDETWQVLRGHLIAQLGFREKLLNDANDNLYLMGVVDTLKETIRVMEELSVMTKTMNNLLEN